MGRPLHRCGFYQSHPNPTSGHRGINMSGGGEVGGGGGGGGGGLVPTMPGCVCPKVKDMGPFSAASE